MTREEILEGLYEIKNWKCNGDAKTHKVVAEAIKALEQESTTKIEESNFSQEQYKADLQCAYDCGKSIIDKIRAKIKSLKRFEIRGEVTPLVNVERVLEIIDKAESEE